MKILAICSAIDISFGGGCTPAWWQLFKGLYEIGHDVVVVPYHGKKTESLWWRSYDNPFHRNIFGQPYLSIVQNYLNRKSEKILGKLSGGLIKPRWQTQLAKILKKEFDAVLVMSLPLNQLHGLPTFIKKHSDVPVVFYEGDMPIVLPKYGGFGRAGSYYVNADLAEYDAFITNSKGAIPELKKMGAKKAYAIYWGVDPSVFSPIAVKQDIDVFYYAHGTKFREDWIRWMIAEPSKALHNLDFRVGGRSFDIDLGRAKQIGEVPFSVWRRLCCSSKINLNITRRHHAEVFATSTSRIFELAALGCCVVSNPYNGLSEWFDTKKEVLVIENKDEVTKILKWLISSDNVRLKMGKRARKKVLKYHTHIHRANELAKILDRLS